MSASLAGILVQQIGALIGDFPARCSAAQAVVIGSPGFPHFAAQEMHRARLGNAVRLVPIDGHDKIGNLMLPSVKPGQEGGKPLAVLLDRHTGRLRPHDRAVIDHCVAGEAG